MLNLMKCCQCRSYILSWTVMHCTEACEHAPRAMLRKKACGNTVQDDFVTKMFLSHLRAHYKNENKILLSPMVFE